MGTILSESPIKNPSIDIPPEQMLKFLSRYKNLRSNATEIAAKSPCKRLKLSIRKVPRTRNKSATNDNSYL